MNIIYAKDEHEASQKTLELLKQKVDQNTLLLLSGGQTPKTLYTLISQDQSLKPGAVALLDERFGEPNHPNSNERMIEKTGLWKFFQDKKILIYKILEPGKSPEQLANQYNQTIKELLEKYTNKIAIVGLGADCHTVGLKPNLDYDHSKLVITFDDIGGYFGIRITTTFESLEKIDEFLLLVLGEGKRKAIEKSLSETDQKQYPGVFYKNHSDKTTIISDLFLGKDYN